MRQEVDTEILPPPPPESIHRIPHARVVDRTEFLAELSRGKRVVHLGFVDVGRMSSKRERGAWLHERLAGAARELVGIDLDQEGVALAQSLGFGAYVADCEDEASIAALALAPADLLIAGELIEHLDRPGAFLEAVKPLLQPSGVMVITTQNASALTNVVAGGLGLELVNSDHVGWQSWHTLKTLLERHGWRLSQLAYYRWPRFAVTPELSRRHRQRVRLFNLYRRLAWPVFRLRPSLADGIIVVASPVH